MLFPVGDMLKGAWAELYARRAAYVRLSILPTVILFLLNLASAQQALLLPQANPYRDFSWVLSSLLGLIVLISWFRHVMGVEESPPLLRSDGARLLRVIWAAIKYTAFMAGPMIAAGLLVGLIGFSGMTGRLPWVLGMLIAAVAIVWMIYACVRLVIYLPGVALDETYGLRQAFAATKPHAAGIFWLLLAALALLFVASVIALAIPTSFLSVEAQAGPIMIGWFTFVNWVTGGFWLSLNAQIYRRLKGDAA